MYNVRMFEFVKNSDLVVNGFLEICVFLKSFEVNLFDGDFIFGDVFEALEYFTERALAETSLHVVAVFADGFDGGFGFIFVHLV